MTDLDQALKSLPHGPEFRFVDELVALELGKSSTGKYVIKTDAHFLLGHFPDRPMMPAVLLLEALAQVAGIAAQTDPVIPAMDDLRLTAIRNVKVYGAALPGETLLIESAVQGRMDNVVLATGKISVDGRLLAEGQVTLSGQIAA